MTEQVRDICPQCGMVFDQHIFEPDEWWKQAVDEFQKNHLCKLCLSEGREVLCGGHNHMFEGLAKANSHIGDEP